MSLKQLDQSISPTIRMEWLGPNSSPISNILEILLLFLSVHYLIVSPLNLTSRPVLAKPDRLICRLLIQNLIR